MDYSHYWNPNIAAVPKSGIRKFFDIVQTMPGAISLGVGEPDFVTPYHIRNAAIDSLLDGETQYTSNWGKLSLRNEIAYYLQHRYSLTYDPQKEILVTVGASEGIDLALRALLNPGDEVLVPEPSYVSYRPGVVFAGGVPVPIKTDAARNFVLTPEELEASIGPRTKALILPYPNNPTGAVIGREALQKLRDVIVRHDLLVVSDEIYSELSYGEEDHVSIASLPEMWERTVYLNGFSKAFAMTGWRVGYLCAPAQLMDVIVKIHQYTIMCASTQGQVAAEEALRQGREDHYADVETMRRSYDHRRRLMFNAFREMGLSCFEPLGAFYVFPGIEKTGLSSEEFCEKLLRQKEVACVPGTAFGACGEGHIRCCYATALDKLDIALKRIADFVHAL
ncbi:MAG TPA: aminotransferase class I/II-fold pyridoxal phosphate-dependent enzyme [Candidatus Limiplasma sp.]|nr:aminotransferase class I/II-fold pyridoxal phosphate-dependent enzyme [Candidatus Limiplasma sp.]HPS81324.1 aminotransferase class I/II-fold pyridoxal phosphate-dependent enzyme [Candidatus Limiplasma sp.]